MTRLLTHFKKKMVCHQFSYSPPLNADEYISKIGKIKGGYSNPPTMELPLLVTLKHHNALGDFLMSPVFLDCIPMEIIITQGKNTHFPHDDNYNFLLRWHRPTCRAPPILPAFFQTSFCPLPACPSIFVVCWRVKGLILIVASYCLIVQLFVSLV